MKKIIFIAVPLILLGIVLFALAKGNETTTFIGFASIVSGLITLLFTLWKKIFKNIWFWLPATLVSGILSLIICILFFVVFFFPNETARKVLQEQMAIELGRPVSIGSLHVSLLDGIQLHNLKIMDKNKKNVFVKAQSLILSYRLLPVLTGKIIISKAVLKNPQINIRRYLINGKPVMNIDDLLGSPSVAMVSIPPEPSGTSAPALPFSVHIGKIGLEGGGIQIQDTAAKNLKSNYRLDKLDIVIENFNWPATSPLSIHFNFRIAMDEIDAKGHKTGKSFTTTQGFKGKITLIKNGLMKPEGSIAFFAKNGIFTGQQLLNAGNSFLNNIKKDFFKKIKKEALKQINFFETLVNKKMQQVSANSRKKIKNLVGAAEKEKNITKSSLLGKKQSALVNFNKEAKSLIKAIDKETDSLVKSVNKAYREISKIYPGAKKKTENQ